MSRGHGRWQRLLLDALDDGGRFSPLSVADVGMDAVGGSMSPAEYRALNRAAWQLNGRALHLMRADGADCRGRPSPRLAAWTCPKCSPAAASQHTAMQQCMICRKPTEGIDFRGRGDCGAHRAPPDPRSYTIDVSDKQTMLVPIEPVILVNEDGTVALCGLDGAG